jgi:hypothetical protein
MEITNLKFLLDGKEVKGWDEEPNGHIVPLKVTLAVQLKGSETWYSLLCRDNFLGFNDETIQQAKQEMLLELEQHPLYGKRKAVKKFIEENKTT